MWQKSKEEILSSNASYKSGWQYILMSIFDKFNHFALSLCEVLMLAMSRECAFIALMLLVEQQEGHSLCNNCFTTAWDGS